MIARSSGRVIRPLADETLSALRSAAAGARLDGAFDSISVPGNQQIALGVRSMCGARQAAISGQEGDGRWLA